MEHSDRYYELKKEIATLEWDINNMTNKELRTFKESMLNQLRQEFKKLEA